MSDTIAICFTQGHQEKLVIEEVQHEGLVDMLFKSGYRLGKIETWVSWQKLADYLVLVIGAPQEIELQEMELKAILEFVNEGGSLLLVADEGGDEKAKSNLNALASQFGFSFKHDILSNPSAYVEKHEYMLLTSFERHFVTRDVGKVVYASGCSIELHDKTPLVLARAGLDAQRKVYSDGAWGEPEPAADAPVIVIKRHGKGKVVAIGNFSIITSLSRIYGLHSADNFILVGNIFAWLCNKKVEDEDGKTSNVFLNVAIEPEVYYWIERELKNKGRFENVNELINFALKAVKQSFKAMEKEDEPEEKD